LVERKLQLNSFIIGNALKQKRIILTEIESKHILSELGIKTTEIKLAHSENEAVIISEAIGFPVVMKISSPDITHKSDAGGVKVGLKSPSEVVMAYKEILTSCTSKRPDAQIEGVTIQYLARPGIEIIIGMTKDPQFGPVMMFGLGGIWVEILKDISFRIVPLTMNDALSMIKEIKGFSILKGYRGMEAVNIGSLGEILVKISSFVENDSRIKEIDLNPIFAYQNEALVVDARIILEKDNPA
jgi:acyl-CoA synthetase (NDP forming)